MNRPSFARQALALALAATTLGASAQTTPAAQLEKSQVLAGGNVVTAYRVPVVSSTGAVKYYDMSFVLGVSTAGVPSFSKFTSAVSPTTQGTTFIAGKYKTPEGRICQVTTAVLSGGRQQLNISCNHPTTSNDALTMSLATGTISGHPYQTDLTAAKIGDITGYAQYAWGKSLYAQNWNWVCLGIGHVVSAVQAGNQIAISAYGHANRQLCGSVMTLQ